MLGYEPRQILLLHANWLEADHVAELLDALRKRGYQFITLQEALSDPVYSAPDDYAGEESGDGSTTGPGLRPPAEWSSVSAVAGR